jgi:hypothetical protein
MKRIWVFGDSFSAANDRQALERWRVNYIKWKGYPTKVFSDFLSEKLNISSRNMGISGTDNYTIMDTIIDSLDKINPNDIIIIGWTSTIRFRVCSKNGTFLTIRPNDLDIKKSTITDTTFLTNMSVDCLNEIVVNRNEDVYIEEINRYIKLINHIYPKNIIINWSPFDQGKNGMLVTPIKKNIKRITDETNGEIVDNHFSEFGHEQISEYFKELIDNYDNSKKLKLL